MALQARNRHIDQLRGLAILIVLIGHSPRYIGEWSPVLPSYVYEHLVAGAYYGVTIFFVISGYLIMSKFLTHNSSYIAIDMRKFYIERIGRIIPPLALLIIVSAAIACFIGTEFAPTKILDCLISLLTFDFNAAAQFIPHTESSWDALWSLRVEETFYVFLPIITLLAVQTRFVAMAAATAVCIGFLRRTENNGDIYSFYTTFDQLAVGVIVAIYAQRLRAITETKIRSILRWSGGALMVAVFFSAPSAGGAIWCTAMALGTALVIIAAPTSESSRAIFRPVEAFGRLSYEIYLFHMMIFWALKPVGFLTLKTPFPHLAAVALLVGALSLCLGTGLLLAKTYSEPLNRIIRRKLLAGAPQQFFHAALVRTPMPCDEPDAHVV